MSFIAILAIATLLAGCAFVPVKRSKNIVFQTADSATGRTRQSLNVFTPRRRQKPLPVYIFFYGGNWTSGRKGLYSFFGNRMARKRVMTVIPDYPKSPEGNYNDMARTAAMAVKWVKENAALYGGDPDRIFISGHSAGGQISSLIGVRDEYFDSLGIKNPVKGLILIDAAGLDMWGYMKAGDYGPDNSYLKVFGREERQWKPASPLFYITRNSPPMLIYSGERTYPSIAISNKKLADSCRLHGPYYEYRVVKRKKHIPMITQFFSPYNPRYREITDFMKRKGE